MAEVHVAAMASASAYGRYLVSSDRGVSHLDMAGVFRADPVFAGKRLPGHERNETKYVPLYDSSKVRRDLGMELRPVGESLLDMARDLVAKGMV